MGEENLNRDHPLKLEVPCSQQTHFPTRKSLLQPCFTLADLFGDNFLIAVALKFLSFKAFKLFCHKPKFSSCFSARSCFCSGRNMTWQCLQRQDKLLIQKLPQLWCLEATCEPDKQWMQCMGAVLSQHCSPPCTPNAPAEYRLETLGSSCVVLCFPARLWRQSIERQNFPILLHRCISSNENISRGLEIHFQSKTAFSALFSKYCNAAILHWGTLRCSAIIESNPHQYEWLWLSSLPDTREKEVGYIEVETAQYACLGHLLSGPWAGANISQVRILSEGKASHPSHSQGEAHMQLWTLDFADYTFPCSVIPSLSFSPATELTLAVFPRTSLFAKSFTHLNWISQLPCHYFSPLLPPSPAELHINLPIFDNTALSSILLWHQEKIMHRSAILHSVLTPSSCPEQFKTLSQEMLSSPP